MRKNLEKLFYFFNGVAVANFIVFCTVFPKPAEKWKRNRYDCALVCGCPARFDGTVSDFLRSRVEKAVDLWKAGKVKYLVFSGANVKNKYVEAEVMRKYAVSAGVPEEKIFLEKKAVSTYHNVMYGKEIMKEQGWTNCVVVTSPWHLRKANHYAQKFGLDYVMCSARDPRNRSIWEIIEKYIVTDFQMYWNFYRRLY